MKKGRGEQMRGKREGERSARGDKGRKKGKKRARADKRRKKGRNGEK